MSMKLTPLAARRTSACPGPGRGVAMSTSCRFSGPPGTLTCIALIAQYLGGAGFSLNAAYFLILEAIPPKLWGSQSWLQGALWAAFSRPLPCEGSLTSGKSRLKGGCGQGGRQDCPPHNKCRTSPTREEYAALGTHACRVPTHGDALEVRWMT